ncbi:hypothetical protein T08_3693 [Trichinella sp. T8]|nr:hypothetical protein T08_3693 [Trichinella sp. T8]
MLKILSIMKIFTTVEYASDFYNGVTKWKISVFEVVNGIPILLTASNWLYSNARFILILILDDDDDDDEPGHWELAMTNTFIWHKAQSCGRSQLD